MIFFYFGNIFCQYELKFTGKKDYNESIGL